MSLLSAAQSGVKEESQFYVIYGVPKVGKTTFAANWPNAIFFDLEDGSKGLPVTRLGSSDLPTWKSIEAATDELLEGKHQYKTLVIDSITKLEGMIHAHLCLEDKVDSIEKYDSGFGKGFTKSREIMFSYIGKLKTLQTKLGMEIILIGHCHIKSFTDPLVNQTYDRYVIQAHEKFTQIITANADNVLFVKHQVNTAVDKRTKKTKAFSDGTRVIHTEWSVSAEAGNRLGLPSELPLDYQAFREALSNTKPKSSDELVNEIKTLMSEVDQDTKSTIEVKLQEASNDPVRLMRIKKKVLEIVQSV